MFSRRSRLGEDATDEAAHETPLARAIGEARARGGDLLDLTESTPARVGLGPDYDLVRVALADPRGALYTPEAFGLRAAREALAAHLRARGASVDADSLMLTASTSEAYAYLFKLLCDPGDEVLVPAPSYPLFAHLTAYEGIRALPYPLRYDGRWHVDLGAVRAARSARTRALLVVHPNNPTGSFLKRDEHAALCDLGLPLIVDEVFSPYALREDSTRASFEGTSLLTFSLGGLSKFAALPQLKLAWTRVEGPRAEKAVALARLELIADSYLSVATPVSWALPAILEGAPHTQAAIRARAAQNLGALERAFAPALGISVLDVEGGWYATLRLPSVLDEEAWTLRLLDAGVLVQPGYFFDFAGGTHLVLSLLPEPPRFDEACARISHAVADLLA